MARFLRIKRTLSGEFFQGSPPTPIPAALLATLPYQRVLPVSAIRAVTIDPEVGFQPDPAAPTPKKILVALNVYLELMDTPPPFNAQPSPDGLPRAVPPTLLVPLGRLTKLEPARIANLVAFAASVNAKLLSATDIEDVPFTDFDA